MLCCFYVEPGWFCVEPGLVAFTFISVQDATLGAIWSCIPGQGNKVTSESALKSRNQERTPGAFWTGTSWKLGFRVITEVPSVIRSITFEDALNICSGILVCPIAVFYFGALSVSPSSYIALISLGALESKMALCGSVLLLTVLATCMTAHRTEAVTYDFLGAFCTGTQCDNGKQTRFESIPAAGTTLGIASQIGDLNRAAKRFVINHARPNSFDNMVSTLDDSNKRTILRPCTTVLLVSVATLAATYKWFSDGMLFLRHGVPFHSGRCL